MAAVAYIAVGFKTSFFLTNFMCSMCSIHIQLYYIKNQRAGALQEPVTLYKINQAETHVLPWHIHMAARNSLTLLGFR